MKKYLLFLLFFASVAAHAQMLIKGKVVDEKDKTPLPGISIYINNSTIGTTTNSEGKFSLTVPFSGKVELVASHIAYQKKIVLIEGGRDEELVLSLEPQDKMLDAVIIRATKNKDDNFKKWGEFFTKVLLGNDTHYSYGCTIKNPNAVAFYYDKERSELKAFAKSPIEIENSLLGYVVKLDLEEFSYVFDTDVLLLKYSSFFEDMKRSKSTPEQLNLRRNNVYYGSKMHFMRALYANMLTKEGFTLYAYKSVKNAEKKRVEAVVQRRLSETFTVKTSANYNLKTLFKDRDTANYYDKVMKEDAVLLFDTTYVSPRRLTQLDRALHTAAFGFKDTLMVSYKPQPSNLSNTAIAQAKSHGFVTANMSATRKDKITFMYFVSEGKIHIQSNGYYPEDNLFIYGDMAERRISQLLPWDFVPSL